MSQSGIKEPGKRQWRDYRTASGNRPVKAFLDGLSDDELASVVAEMKAVAAMAWVKLSLVAEAEARKDIARALAARREKRRLSQTQVAALMNTSASVVSKLESGGDVKLSTMQRYCSVIGAKLPIAG
jgi:DNA-binding transcriptional regulator YiaG